MDEIHTSDFVIRSMFSRVHVPLFPKPPDTALVKLVVVDLSQVLQSIKFIHLILPKHLSNCGGRAMDKCHSGRKVSHSQHSGTDYRTEIQLCTNSNVMNI